MGYKINGETILVKKAGIVLESKDSFASLETLPSIYKFGLPLLSTVFCLLSLM